MVYPVALALPEKGRRIVDDLSSDIPQAKGPSSCSHWTNATTLVIMVLLVGSLAAFSSVAFSPVTTASLLMQYGQANAGTLKEETRGSNWRYDLTSEDIGRLSVMAEEDHQLNVQRRERRFESRRKMDMTSFTELFLVPTYPCIHEERFGLWGEGGKWICLVHRNVSTAPVAISVGSRGEVSFERDLALRLNAFSHTFDFTLPPKFISRMQSLDFLKFYNAGLAGASEVQSTKQHFRKAFPRANIVSVPTMLKMVNATWINIFKIDCEGCEFGVVEDMSKLYAEAPVPFGQIQVEVHSRTHPKTLRLIRLLEGLSYRMFHAEPNPYCASCYELAFIHASLVKPRAL